MAEPTISDSVVATGAGISLPTGDLVIASGDTAYVIVILVDGAPADVSSVTSSGGGTFTSIGDSGAVETYLRAHVWRCTNPTAGTVTITANLSAANGDIAVIAVAVSGVDSGNPNGTPVFTSGVGAADAYSAAISSSTNAIVLDFISRIQRGAMNILGGQTLLEQAPNAAVTVHSSSSWEAGAASVVTSWGINGAGSVNDWQWVLGALSINGAGAGGGGSILPPVPAQVISQAAGRASLY